MMVRQISVEVGERFRPTGDAPFGRAQAVWRVIGSFEGTDGMTYAHLISESDPTSSKTVSVVALLDKRLYRQEAAA
jgi:hypothetical protein